MIQSAVIIVLTLLVIISAVTYAYITGTYYVEYTESSDIDYSVQLKENEFYDTQYLGKDRTYVATLIDSVIANLKYELDTDAEDVYYDYSYSVEAELRIVDGRSDEAIFNPVYPIKSGQRTTQSTSDKLRINELVVIDYDMYNELATAFVNTYELPDVTSTLIVRMTVNVYGDATSLDGISSSSHTSTLDIPLTDKTVDIEMTSSVPTAEKKMIACDAGAVREVFKIAAIVLAVVDALAVILLISFIRLTRTKDITYAGRIKRILSHYKSYIQRINNPFDMTGYKVLYVDTFDEMLEIRDTISSPILMYENDDKTSTTFVIPTNTMLLYLHEIKVDGYDELYGESEPVVEEPTVEEPVVEEPVVEEPTVEEPVVEEPVVEEPVVILAAVPEEPEVTEPEPVVIPVEESEPEEEGVEVIGVVWPETGNGKIYRYDPDGEKLDVGDVVLVPSRDVASNKDIEREAEVAEANHRVDPATLQYPLKKIIRVVKRKAQDVFTSMILKDEE